eukprot:CAMPEP_0115035016 /NCGR_PEP_ID=MMETSP0216-20121206/41119_1 /TAXON_ID=223996 /ORGANISM="Protocruzia adherens, Strain Boccale" /LENGTH=46 /DNA_ID= /DNA_START= /DNA_END= /DNA_ORIENTATION=
MKKVLSADPEVSTKAISEEVDFLESQRGAKGKFTGIEDRGFDFMDQ